MHLSHGRGFVSIRLTAGAGLRLADMDTMFFTALWAVFREASQIVDILLLLTGLFSGLT